MILPKPSATKIRETIFQAAYDLQNGDDGTSIAAGFSVDEFVDRGFDALADMRHRALFILHCTLTPKLTNLMSGIFKEYNLGITDMFAPPI